MKTIRIDTLPQSVQDQIMALRAKHVAGSGIVTQQQLERATAALDANRLPVAHGDWNASNAATALGRLVMRYFNEYPEQKRTFAAYIARLKTSGVAVDRPGRKKTNGHATP